MTTRADRVEGGDKDKLAALAVKMHRARVKVERLRKERVALACERDYRKQPEACWRYKTTPDQVDGFGGVELRGCREYAGGGSCDIDGTLGPEDTEPSEHWCASCRQRKQVRAQEVAASRALGALKSAFWRMAKRLAEPRVCKHGKTIDVNGCQECDLFRCPRCFLEVSWDEGGTDDEYCAQCWSETTAKTK